MKNFITILLFVFCISCNNPADKKTDSGIKTQEGLDLTPTFKVLSFNDKVEVVVKEFLAVDTCKDCLHEIHIDKVRPDYTIIVIKSRPYSADYLKTVNPLFTTKLDGVIFSVFTGVEDIITGDKSRPLRGDSASNNFRVWSIFIGADSLTVEKDVGIPFYPATPPNIGPEK